MDAQGMKKIRRLGRRGAFVAELQNLMEEAGCQDVAGLARDVGIDRVRLYQILAQTTPPPGPEIIDRIADALALSTVQRRWLQWLGLRDRADPHSRVLLELYEAELLRLWGKDDPHAIPAELGSRMEEVNFVVTSKPVYLRHSIRPVHAILHNEGGRMKETLLDGCSVEIEPAGRCADGEALLAEAVDHVVLVNAGRRCRIGWLRPQGEGFVLQGDDNKPLRIKRLGYYRDATEELRIHRKAVQRPYVGDIQGFLSDEVMEAIKNEKRRLAETEQSRKQQDLLSKIYVFKGSS